MRKLILLAVASYLWRKFAHRAPMATRRLSPFRR
jgi:hypothetical protein